MEKLELKIADKVELWNGTLGDVTELKFPIITIQNKNSYPIEFHRINLKFVNGVFVDVCDVVF